MGRRNAWEWGRRAGRARPRPAVPAEGVAAVVVATAGTDAARRQAVRTHTRQAGLAAASCCGQTGPRKKEPTTTDSAMGERGITRYGARNATTAFVGREATSPAVSASCRKPQSTAFSPAQCSENVVL